MKFFKYDRPEEYFQGCVELLSIRMEIEILLLIPLSEEEVRFFCTQRTAQLKLGRNAIEETIKNFIVSREFKTEGYEN